MKKELEDKTKLADEYLARLKYLQADFDIRRWLLVRGKCMRCATEELKNLLPIIDNSEAAIAPRDRVMT